jgi:hypothetical protein
MPSGAERPRPAARLPASLLGTLLLTACAACPAGTAPATSAELFLGRAIPGGGVVAEADWQDFLDRVATPAFPDGLTVLPATGQWREASGTLLREEARVLRLVLPGVGAAAARARLAPVAQRYRERFGQDSVLVVQQPVCAAF